MDISLNNDPTQLVTHYISRWGLNLDLEINFIGQTVEVNSADALKKLCLDLKPQLQNYLVVLASNTGGKANVAIMISEEVAAIKTLDATKIIKEYIAPLIKGGGGGQKILATAGGQDASNADVSLPKRNARSDSLLE